MNGRGRRRSGPPTPTQQELMIDNQDFHEEEDDEKHVNWSKVRAYIQGRALCQQPMVGSLL